MPRFVQIIFGIIGLGLILYVAILGLNAFFEWIDPAGSSGRMARITTGAVIGLVITLVIIALRRFRR